MTQYLVVVVVIITSSVAYLVGVAGFGLSRADLRAAVGRVFECVGLTLIFYAANLLVGILAVLGVRVLANAFLSLYLADETLLDLSFIQGFTFAYWRDHAVRYPVGSGPDDPGGRSGEGLGTIRVGMR